MHLSFITFTIFFGAIVHQAQFINGEIPCTQHDECLYGRCDSVTGSCSCGVNCDRFSRTSICTRTGCPANAKVPCRNTEICLELEAQCNDKTTLKRFFLTPSTANCRRQVYEDSNQSSQFCGNQRFCNDNGICVRTNGIQHCICKDNYRGERCQERIPMVSLNQRIRVSSSKLTSVGKLLTSPSVVLVMSAALPCMIFIIFIKKRRQSNASSSTECAKTNEKKQKTFLFQHKEPSLVVPSSRNDVIIDTGKTSQKLILSKNAIGFDTISITTV